ncbi:DNA polymerase III subunit beta [Roseofilum reptotaenium CS-1145]|uniref:Beta sliding clamp n=1 Tax=Roseofilum reptotaenium AO1-A TaxID=1925591 RepID=A0A1L9QMQ5_9CYAN|nr:DNA polymerase III subunit beta [Roseofilum reptotaenium]MDB9517654.1 DNA polymerase III subunit beta [Roseofilum reptotaenium CS-1145]OJJ22717.1 DNA polymerase III subunit beta [Roseofilum reptotaenium AO1-A]
MKLVCTQSDLSTNLSLVSRAIPSRPSQPILSNVRFIADLQNQEVSLTAFDLSLGIQARFPATVEEDGDLALPAKLLNDMISRLPSGDLTLETDSDDGETLDPNVTITCSCGRYQLRGLDPEDYPALPIIDTGEILTLPSAAILEGLRGCLFATSLDETKQVLTGVHLTVKEDSVEFAATDGHRLAVVTTSTEKDEEENVTPIQSNIPFEVTVPGRALREIERMIGSHKEDISVDLTVDEGQVVFQLPSCRLNCRTLDGQYPAYEQLIPQVFERQIDLDRRQLLSSVERIAILADQKNNVIMFSLQGETQEVILSVEATDVGSATESISATISGEDLQIAFNVKYLVDALKAIPSQELKIQVNTADKPVILSPLGAIQMTCLLMPVQIRS